MAVVSVSAFEALPGKVAETVALLKEAQELLTAKGANVQVTSLTSGGVPGTLSIVSESADPVAYGALMDELNADEGFQGFMARAQASASAQPVRSVDYVELAGLERSFADIAGCRVAQASLFRIRDGHQQVSIERIQRWKALTEKHGGKCRALSAVASDPAFLTATVAYYDSFKQWGEVGQSLGADADWQALIGDIRGSEASGDFLRTVLMQVI
jgi:hypothetical protein